MMDVLLKKYFWILNLAVVGVCAMFAGRALGHFIEGAYLGGGDMRTPVRRAAPPLSVKVHGKDAEAIVTRNIFCSGCAPTKPVAVESAPQSNEPQKTSLQLE